MKQPCESLTGSWKHNVLDLPLKCSLVFFPSFKTFFFPPSKSNLPLGSWITALIQATASSLTKLLQTSQNDTWGPALCVTHSINASLSFLVDITCVCCLYDHFFWVLQIFILSDFYSNKFMYLPTCVPVMQADCSIVWLSKKIFQYLPCIGKINPHHLYLILKVIFDNKNSHWKLVWGN